ncbi:MAG: nuclear transport factor 2 family protein [Candidatus Binatia bacterium]|nr:nuclear transport factor 2 family protein [Candidatus Binatia bacterium]
MQQTDRDILEINNLLAEYCLACDECRFDDFARLFGTDGEMHAFRRVWKGFDELVSFISAAPEGIHLCGLPRISLDGDRAECTVNFVFVTHDKQVGSLGLYIDELGRTPEGWRFRTRKIKILRPSEKAA